MLTKVLTMVQKFLLKCTGENTHKNYNIVVPRKQAAWPGIWNEFLDGVIIPYLKRGLGNVRNRPLLGGIVAVDARVDYLIGGHSRFRPKNA
jgi:hypothetical protein